MVKAPLVEEVALKKPKQQIITPKNDDLAFKISSSIPKVTMRIFEGPF